jgi:hypothetical protein
MKKHTKTSSKLKKKISTKQRKQNKDGLSFVENLNDFRNLLSQGYHEYRIALAGTAGAIFSRKDIVFDNNKRKFHIINWIDDSEQLLSEKQILSKKYTNIGEALKKNCLIVDLNEKY